MPFYVYVVILSEAGVPQGGTTAESKDPYLDRPVGTAAGALFLCTSPPLRAAFV